MNFTDHWLCLTCTHLLKENLHLKLFVGTTKWLLTGGSCLEVTDYIPFDTINSEIFARILFSRIMLKDMFAMLKIRDWSIIYLHQ